MRIAVGLIALFLAPAPAHAQLSGYRATYDMVIELNGSVSERGYGTLNYEFRRGCGVDTVALEIETTTPEETNSEPGQERRMRVVQTERERHDGSHFEMRSEAEISIVDSASGAVVNTDRAVIDAIGDVGPDGGVLTIVDRSFDVDREESIDLPQGTLFPIAALQRQLSGAADGLGTFDYPALRADRRTVINEQVEVQEAVIEAIATTVSDAGAMLLARRGWNVLVMRQDLEGEEVGREEAVILENGVVFHSIYTAGRLRSIASLRTLEPFPAPDCGAETAPGEGPSAADGTVPDASGPAVPDAANGGDESTE